MSEYRRLEEEGRKYAIDGRIYDVKQNISGRLLVSWQDRLERDPNDDFLTQQKKGQQLTKEIIEEILDVKYDSLLEFMHPKEIEGVAADLFIFLYAIGTERERNLLNQRLKEKKSTMV